MELKKLGCGMEIRGVNIAGGLSDREIDGIRKSFAEHGLIFIRDQQISKQDHINFAKQFGEINVNRFFQAHPEFPQVALVIKEPEQEQNIGGGWHTDHSYDEVPALGSILAARDLPESGGDTWFVSMYDAMSQLSDGLRGSLKNLRAVHSAHHVFGSNVKVEGASGGRIGNAESADRLSDPIHPVVIKHPLSRREALYVNPGFTLHFEGWSDRESQPLLEFLYNCATREENITRFNWERGSIAFWDNRATWHFAQNDYHGLRREMHRITIEGCELEAAG